MGYRSVLHVPQVSTYAQAKRTYDKSVPIRGRSIEVRPLGKRKDVDTYWCRMKEDGSEDIEFMLYRTAVLTFKKDGDVVVQTNGYSTISTHEFISHVLPMVSCRGQRSNTVLEIRGNKFIVPKNQAMTLRMVDGVWTVPEPIDSYEYRLDRKAAKEVRAKYKDFYTYVNSMVKIRSVTQEPPQWARSQTPYPVIEFNPQEFVDMLGFELHLVTGGKRVKRTFVNIHERKVELDFYISGDQPAEVRNDNFYAAFLGMAMDEHNHWETYNKSERPMQIKAKLILARIDEQILRAHAKDVLVWTRLAQGVVPAGDYKDWINLDD